MLHSVKKGKNHKLPLEKDTKNKTYFFPINGSSTYLNMLDFHENYMA